MNKNKKVDKFKLVLDELNQAFKDDPAAIQSLLQNRVPCNDALVAHPTVQVTEIATISGEYYAVGALGLVNSVIETIFQKRIAVKFSEPDELGVSKIIGFCEYKKEKTK